MNLLQQHCSMPGQSLDSFGARMQSEGPQDQIFDHTAGHAQELTYCKKGCHLPCLRIDTVQERGVT